VLYFLKVGVALKEPILIISKGNTYRSGSTDRGRLENVKSLELLEKKRICKGIVRGTIREEFFPKALHSEGVAGFGQKSFFCKKNYT